MADLSINMLPVSDGLTDDGLLVVYQNNEAQSIKGELVKQFARGSVTDLVTAAQNAAAQAEQAAKDAKVAAEKVAYANEKAEEAAQAALAAKTAQEAAEAARQAAEQAAALAAQQAVADAENRLQGYVTDAESAKNAAQTAAGNAASAVVTTLQRYLSEAEQARDDAQSAARTTADETAAAIESDMNGYVVAAEAARAAAEQAKADAENAAAGAAQRTEAKLQGYVTDAENAKKDAQQAAETAAEEAADLVDAQMAQYVSDAQAAQKAAETARDEAQGIAGGQFLPLTGGTMTGPINMGTGAYIQNKGTQVTQYQNPVAFNVYSITTVGTIDINLGNKASFLALEFALASYGMNMLLNLSGYCYTSSTFFYSPLATGVCNGFVPKVRAAVDADGNRHFLLGAVDTNWTGYIRGGITKLIKMGGDHAVAPNVSISFLTDETDLFTWQTEVPVENLVPYNPANLSSAVPIAKGGTGGATAAEARTALDVPSTNEMTTAIASAIGTAIGGSY